MPNTKSKGLQNLTGFLGKDKGQWQVQVLLVHVLQQLPCWLAEALAHSFDALLELETFNPKLHCSVHSISLSS